MPGCWPPRQRNDALERIAPWGGAECWNPCRRSCACRHHAEGRVRSPHTTRHLHTSSSLACPAPPPSWLNKGALFPTPSTNVLAVQVVPATSGACSTQSPPHPLAFERGSPSQSHHRPTTPWHLPGGSQQHVWQRKGGSQNKGRGSPPFLIQGREETFRQELDFPASGRHPTPHPAPHPQRGCMGRGSPSSHLEPEDKAQPSPANGSRRSRAAGSTSRQRGPGGGRGPCSPLIKRIRVAARPQARATGG